MGMMTSPTTDHHHPAIRSFAHARAVAASWLAQAPVTHPETWQSLDARGRPELRTAELLNFTLSMDLKGIRDLDHWREDVKPQLPWADDHFEERVCGAPINPGVEWANWGWGASADRFRDGRGMFNHNYMERYWPKFAGAVPKATTTNEEWLKAVRERGPERNRGIRGHYGDFDDLVSLLCDSPATRQAWIPIFHPEDTGDANPGRKPCSLGYQFIVREDRMHVYYPLRSCDFFHHMPDDIYLTIRLLLWVLEECRARVGRGYWDKVQPGSFFIHCTSLHVFANDIPKLKELAT